MRRIAWLAALLGCGLLSCAVVMLERARAGLEIRALVIGQTPATLYQQPMAQGPAIIIAPGFAGTRPLMQSYALSFAQAGYRVVSFEFQGHGQNPVPLSGDLSREDGVTRLLVTELAAVVDHALNLEGVDGRVMLLGHSMGTNVVVRQAVADPRVDGVIAVSVVSEAITASAPEALLMMNGGLEAVLRAEAARIMALGGGVEGDTLESPLRRAVSIPLADHIGVLYAREALKEALHWADRVFEMERQAPDIGRPGTWVLMALAGLGLLGYGGARALPLAGGTLARTRAVPGPQAAVVVGLASGVSVVGTLLLSRWSASVLGLQVVEPLAMLAALWAAGVLGILWVLGHGSAGRARVWIALAFALFAIGLCGVVLHRYVTGFWPGAARWGVLAVLALGFVPAMSADAALRAGGGWRRMVMVRAGVLGALAATAALDFERLGLLLIPAVLMLAYFVTFGAMAGWASRQSGAWRSIGAASGLTLAWMLSAMMPLFAL